MRYLIVGIAALALASSVQAQGSESISRSFDRWQTRNALERGFRDLNQNLEDIASAARRADYREEHSNFVPQPVYYPRYYYPPGYQYQRIYGGRYRVWVQPRNLGALR